MTADVETLYAAWADKFDAARAARVRLSPFPPTDDFWGDVSASWVPGGAFPGADPQLLALAKPEETWLDIGAGAGRISADLSPLVRAIVACDMSPGMTERLRDTAANAPASNIRVLDPTPWPPVIEVPVCDVALSVMVIFFVREIGPFIDAMEAHASDRCLVLASTHPGGKPHSFDTWRKLHGEDYQPEPAVDDFVAVLRARGAEPAVTSLGFIAAHDGSPVSLDETVARHHARYLVARGTDQEARFRELLATEYGNDDGTVGPLQWGNEAFIVQWSPPAAG